MKLPHDDALANAILETVRLPLLALGADLRVEAANDAFLGQFRVDREETLGRRIYDLGNGQWDIPELRHLLGKVLPERSTVTDYRVVHEFERIGRRIMHLDARRIGRADDQDMILIAISDETERESLRAELVGRIEMADKLIDSVREGLLILDPDLHVRSASASFYETFGVEPAETEGRLVYELGNGQWDIPELRKLLEDVLPQARSFDDYEVTHCFEGLGERVVMLNGRRLDHQDLILLAIRDVTAHRESKARLAEVAQAAHAGVYDVDLLAGKVDWSAELRDIVGYSRDAPLPAPWEIPAFVHPEDRADLARHFEALVQPDSDGTIFHEHRIIRPDGDLRWIRLHGNVEYDGEGAPRKAVRLRGMIMDTTDAKAAEAEQRRGYALLRGIAGGAQDLIAALDGDFRLLYANAAYLLEYRELWGHDLQEGENLLAPMARWPEEQRKAREVWSRALSGEAFTARIPFGPPGGDQRLYDLRFNPVLDEAGEQIGAAHIFRDITEQTRAETSLRESEERQAFLLTLTDALRPLGDPIAELEEAMTLMIRHFGLVRAAFYEVEADEDGVKRLVGVGTDTYEWPDRLKMSDFAPDIAEVYRLRKSYVIEDAQTDPRLSENGRETIMRMGVRSLVAVPVVKEGRLMTVLTVQARAKRTWRRTELQLLEEVAERIWSTTERVRADAALKDTTERLRDARQRQDLAVDAAGLGVWEWKAAEDQCIWEDGRTHEIFGLPPRSAPINYDTLVSDFLHPDDRKPLEDALEEGWRKGHYRVECRITRASDGELRWVEFSGRCETDCEGRPARVVGVVADITARKQAEERQDMLMAELDHRVKNILAVVQSMIRQSLGRGKAVGPEATDLLVGRLNALAQSHALLAEGRWEGTCFGDIVEMSVAPYRGEKGARVTVEGPNLTVTPKAAQTLNLALHELVTNAAKYGALSREGGRVAARWQIEGEDAERHLVFTWQEDGGPAIVAAPARKGFGSRLIEQTLSFEIGGEVTLDYARDGLRARFELPLAGLSVDERKTAQTQRPRMRPIDGNPETLRNKKILVVEDEYLIAQETAEGLREAGCTVSGPIATLREALRIAATDDIDAAILDVNLQGELVWPAAHALRARGIPLIFSTGYSDTIKPPSELRDMVLVEKPVRRERLLSALASVVEAS